MEPHLFSLPNHSVELKGEEPNAEVKRK